MKKIDDVKILVFTVDCWNNTGANTMSSLFSWCKPENLANIYIRPGIPNYEGCGSYFQIDENAVIKSIFNRKILTGRTIDSRCVLSVDDNGVNKFYKLRKNRPWLKLYAREFLWKVGKWQSDALNEFLKNFKPDVIVFAYEGLIHFNRLVRYAITFTGAKAIGYFWDDNFTYKQMPGNVGYYIYRFFQRKDIRKTVRMANAHFAITPKTKRECDLFFGIESVLLTKPIKKANNHVEGDYVIHKPIKMLYTGNLGIGRLDTLAIIAYEIKKANEAGIQIVLDIYSNTEIPEGKFDKYKDSVFFHGAVSQDVVQALQEKADVLLFIEDITGNNKHIARLSFSTKLTDYFSAGKCILAVADSEIAPMEYLKSNGIAICAGNRAEVEDGIKKILNEKSELIALGNRAFDLGSKNHNEYMILETLQCTIKNIIDK